MTRRSTQRVTLADVAAAAGVSPQTVSRTLRAPELVSTETLERVNGAIRELGYVPNLAASNLASNRSMTVAAIVPSIAASVFADALEALESVLAPAGYQLFIGATGYSPSHEEELVRAFLGRRPDALFIVGARHTEAASALLRASGIPVVEAWDSTATPIDSIIGFSNEAAIRALVEHVRSRGHAHPTFAGSFQSGDFRAAARRSSFEESISALYPGEAVRVVDSGLETVDLETGRLLLDRVLREHPATDALMFASDVFAAGAVLECARRGIDVPGDLAITGFGDFELAAHLTPTLTTVAVPNREIGTRAGELLLARIADAASGGSAVGATAGGATSGAPLGETIDLGFRVVARDSA